MTNEPMRTRRWRQDRAVVDRFLDSPSEQSFEELFNTFTPQLIAFFRSRRCEASLAEDLAQEVMLNVHHKAGQLRNRTSFRGWLLRIALNVMRGHYSNNMANRVETVDLASVTNRLTTHDSHKSSGTPGFEFLHWMDFLDSRESEVMKLRFIEQWEYHEIAAAHAIPIGTVQWRVFHAKKKLTPHLRPLHEGTRKAA